MKYKILVLLLIVMFQSCGGILTENENEAIDEVLNFFGGYCKYSIGVSADINGEEKKYFELELSKSESLSKFKGHKEIITSKLAYIFFDNLNEEEKRSYTHIRGTLLYDDGERFTQDYSIQELETVKKRLPLAHEVVSLIKNKDFDELETILNDQGAFKYNKSELVNKMKGFEPGFGNITEFRFFGFNFSNAGDSKILKISGIVLRDKQNHELSIYLTPNTKSKEVLKLDYKL